jgi:alpha-galactosidase
VVLFNRSGEARDMTVKWLDIGLMRGRAQVRDLWAHFDRGTVEDQFTVKVPSHDVVMLKIEGQEPLPPSGNVFLSDLTITYAANGWGPVEIDRSVNDEAAGDGKTLTIAGTQYDKGLGVHAGSLVRYRLGKKCTRFRADVGVDDETGDAASVVFEVRVDGEPRYKSSVMKRGMKSSVDVDVTGGRELKLLATNAGDNGEYDHADWANARLDCAP